ncbi:MAG: LysR family transcriptional regulator [Desulfovibrio sp.]|jgi:DNA-binding transcriptional LysR family regulator|nr:LysR family transcriptional regulator [Desulfovibrio sp.]
MNNIFIFLPYFVEVGRRKSFTQAAEALKTPIPTVSRRVAALERLLGTRLLHRNTRNVDLTESGKLFLKRCEQILVDAESAQEELFNNEKAVSGRIRLSMPADIYYLFLNGVLGTFSSMYPSVELHVHFSTRWVDLLTEPYDLDIRLGELPSSELRVKKLFTMELGMYAAPELFKRFPEPQCLKDIEKIPAIFQTHKTNFLELSYNGKIERARLHPVHFVNSMGLTLEFLLAGQGIGALTPSIAKKYEKRGELIRLLPEWKAPTIDVSIVTAPSRLPKRIRLFIDHIKTFILSKNACGQIE